MQISLAVPAVFGVVGAGVDHLGQHYRKIFLLGMALLDNNVLIVSKCSALCNFGHSWS